MSSNVHGRGSGLNVIDESLVNTSSAHPRVQITKLRGPSHGDPEPPGAESKDRKIEHISCSDSD